MNSSEANLPAESCEANKSGDTMGQKKCANCGTEFGCGAAMGVAIGGASFSCWCEKLPSVAPIEGQDCLCPACLREVIAKRGE